jgi:hypothetical protein
MVWEMRNSTEAVSKRLPPSAGAKVEKGENHNRGEEEGNVG